MKRYDAVLFDLLTGLLDSWSLWNAVAGDAERGRDWRAEYLRITYGTGSYRPYEALLEESAVNVGLSRAHAAGLAARFVELQAWPEASETLRALKDAGMKLGVVTNCSERLGLFDTVVTAERAGYYKPDARPYQLALEELNVAPPRCLFVAGSPYDLFGTAQVGLATYWHDRIGITPPEGAPVAMARERWLAPLLEYIGMARPWSEIRAHCVRYAPCGSLIPLVEAIQASRYAGGLFAWMSMHTICITQSPVPEYPYRGPMLLAIPERSGWVMLRYVDGTEPPWERTVSPGDAFAQLERFVIARGWLAA